MAITIISVSAAQATGTTPEQLRQIASWHDWKERLANEEGEAHAARRHQLTAKALRLRARELFEANNAELAAA